MESRDLRIIETYQVKLVRRSLDSLRSLGMTRTLISALFAESACRLLVGGVMTPALHGISEEKNSATDCSVALGMDVITRQPLRLR